MDTLHLPEAGRSRRRYSPEFKAQIVAACLQPGVSTTAIALANQINPNVLRRWIRNHKLAQQALIPSDVIRNEPQASHQPCTPALVPVELAAGPLRSASPITANRKRADGPLSPRPASSGSSSMPPPGDAIRLELRRGDTLLNVAWPALQADVCALWLRELLR